MRGAWSARSGPPREDSPHRICLPDTPENFTNCSPEVRDIVDDVPKSTSDSYNADSVFSTAITLSRATSFVAIEEQDTIAEILHVLVEDPLLSWQKLLRHQITGHNGSDAKDVRLFLRAFESDLRAEADTTLEHHACAFLRHRIPYLSSQICARFNLQENTPSDAAFEERDASSSVQQLQPVTLEEPDPTLMPNFSGIWNFMFGGVAFQALKENVENFAQRERDYNEEVAHIIVRNIHLPNTIAIIVEEQHTEALNELLQTFLSVLGDKAESCILSASDRSGTKGVRGNLSQLVARVSTFWTSRKPLWHFYPLVPVNGDYIQFDNASTGGVEYRTEHELFEAFKCSSKAFLGLSRSVAGLSHEKRRKLRWPWPLRFLHSQGKVTMSSSSLQNTSIPFECYCGQTITDDYAELSLGGIRSKERQLRLLLVRQ